MIERSSPNDFSNRHGKQQYRCRSLDDNKTYFEERITTDDRKTSLEYAILLKNILEIHKVKKNDIEGSIMASVVPPLNAPISSAVKKITGKETSSCRFRHEDRLKHQDG